MGDVILRLDGKEIATYNALPPLVGATRVDEPAKLEVLRGGRVEEITVVIGELPDEGERVAAAESQSAPADSIGLVVGDLSAEQREQLELKQGGVIVQEIKPGPAERAGIGPGDVILRFADQPVEDAARFRELLEGIESGRSVAVLIQRGDGRIFYAVRIPEE